MRRTIGRIIGVTAAMLLLGMIVLTGIVYWQAQRMPRGAPVYAALGSSYAAGAGLGPLQPASPWLCARSVGGYPPRLARLLRLPMVDMTCGGAATVHLLNGGQFFQGPQRRAVMRATRLVTITAGGNDVGLVGDISMLALRREESVRGWFARRMWNGPATHRDFDALYSRLSALVRAIRRQAPDATLVVASYPAILPPAGTCPYVGLSVEEANAMRAVEQRLAAVTGRAAAAGGALFVDMHALGAAHNACSADPWTRGQAALLDAPFHPTARGAQATAAAIAAVLRAHQQV